MNKSSLSICIFSFFLLFVSCNKHSNKIDKIFSEANNIVEQNPDSALTMLDSIRNPYELGKEQHMEFIMYSLQAKDKAYQDITNDTLIFQARDYFKAKNDLEKEAMAEFYCGRVFHEQKKTTEALQSYLEAETTVQSTNKYKLAGLIKYYIATTYTDSHLYETAIPKYREAIINFSKIANDYKPIAYIYNEIGNCFFGMQVNDSSLYYHDIAMDYTKRIDDPDVQANILQNTGVTFMEMDQPQKAKSAFNQALQINVNKSKGLKAKIYINLAKLYNRENALDSSYYYVEKALESERQTDEIYNMANIYKLLSTLEEKHGNYKKSLEDHKEYSKYLASIMSSDEVNSTLEIQKEYQVELIRSANDKLLIERQWLLIGFLLSAVLIGVTMFLLYRKKNQNKKALMIAKEQVYQLKELVGKKSSENEDKRNLKLREVLFQQLDILKKVAMLDPFLNESGLGDGKTILKKVKRIIYGNQNGFDLNLLYSLLNDLYPGYPDQIRQVIPNLSDNEFQICCLSKAGFNNTEIATLMETTANAIQLRKSTIRGKANLKEQGSFIKLLDGLIEKLSNQ